MLLAFRCCAAGSHGLLLTTPLRPMTSLLTISRDDEQSCGSHRTPIAHPVLSSFSFRHLLCPVPYYFQHQI